jgi:hypothetical protein
MNHLLCKKAAGPVLLVFLFTMASCRKVPKSEQSEVAAPTEIAAPAIPVAKKVLSNDFKAYWYAGEAEITSYALEQARYGEMREGKAVLIFVTEPFLAGKQVKADGDHPDNIPVLKLNTTKNYLTGIYPYSIMTSSFYPVNEDGHALKVSFSSQEWCGHVYAQLNNRDQFEVMSHSYFETEADETFELQKTVLENELWNKLRLDPEGLPVGNLDIVPSFEYIRLSHKTFKAYNANAKLTQNNGLYAYEINYPELERNLTIYFNTSFPHSIEGWTETFKSGFGPNATAMTSTAKKIKTIKSPYWQQNSNGYLSLRDSLGL